MDWLSIDWVGRPDAWVALLALSAMEIVLGIDNIVFISILSGRLPVTEQARARRLGLALALVSRLALLFGIKWVMGLDAAFAVWALPWGREWHISGKALILLGGGLFLLYKATTELWHKLEGAAEAHAGGAVASMAAVLVQVALLDMVFSLDSVITAVGMAQDLMVMAIAMVLAVLVMLVFVNRISDFIERHPTLKVLALSFLMLIGVMLVAEGMGEHLGKGYIYAAMAFSLLVELLNMRLRAAHAPVQLHHRPRSDVRAPGT